MTDADNVHGPDDDSVRRVAKKVLLEQASLLTILAKALEDHCAQGGTRWLQKSKAVLLEAQSVVTTGLERIDFTTAVPARITLGPKTDRQMALVLLQKGTPAQQLDAVIALMGKDYLTDYPTFLARLFTLGTCVGLGTESTSDTLYQLLDNAVKGDWYQRVLDRFYS